MPAAVREKVQMLLKKVVREKKGEKHIKILISSILLV
jgi:hypothetical protein